jgi:hypothetical protein
MAYKNPRLKIARSIAFCLFGSFRLLMTGSGRQNTEMSVTRLKPAMTYHIVKASLQCPGKVAFQNFATGIHMRILIKAIVIVQAPMKSSPYKVHCWMIWMEKTRRY